MPNELNEFHAICARLDECLRFDPVGRRTAALCRAQPCPRLASLVSAAASLADSQAVAIVTGFCIVDAMPPAAETDGPPGALFLAGSLLEMGRTVALVSDPFGRPVLEAGCDFLGISRNVIHTAPIEACDPAASRVAGSQADIWVHDFLSSSVGGRLSHLVAIERPGPSHSTASALGKGARRDQIARFQTEVPVEHQDACHNMRGDVIDARTARLHRLFEIAGENRPAIHTIGIGDGGNEIGFGSIGWDRLRAAIQSANAARIACRIATRDLIIGGTSDWAAYALALAMLRFGRRRDLIAHSLVDRQRRLIEALVRESPVVDGITCRREATIDSLPLEVYLRFLDDLIGAAKSI